jgi:hypothetical protein
MKKIKLLTLTLSLGFACLSFGADGSSGCGPGWFILKDNSLLSSALRFTTNTLFAPVTTIGMTFGTSNCTRHKIVLHEKETLYFVEQNFYELKNQVARGTGSHVIALAQTMGCQSDTQLGNHLQKSYSEIFPMQNQPNPSGSLTEIFKAILKNPELAQKCDFPQIG